LPGARDNRAFPRRAVAFLAREGVDQFFDIGSGLPTVGNVHEVMRGVTPMARVVYVDNDPVAVRYSRQIPVEDGVSSVAVIEADLRDPAAILAHPETCRLLNLSRPVALLLAAVLHFIPEEDAALGIVRDLTAALPAGSYMAISHGAYDVASLETLARFARLYEATTHPLGFVRATNSPASSMASRSSLPASYRRDPRRTRCRGRRDAHPANGRGAPNFRYAAGWRPARHRDSDTLAVCRREKTSPSQRC